MDRSAAGKFTGHYGTDGELTAVLYDSFTSKKKGEPLFVIIDGLTVPLFIYKITRRGNSGAIVSIDDVDTRERAELLTGLEFYAEDPYGVPIYGSGEETGSLADLIGFTCTVTETGDSGHSKTIRGTITDYIDSEHNPLFSVRSEDIEFYVPAAVEFIESADFESQIIFFTVPEGITEL